MGASASDENTARLERLEHWAAEQRELTERRQGIPRRAKFTERIADLFLDRGLETGGRALEPEHLAADRIGYAPSAWYTLPRVLRHTGVSREGTFIDFGCGKGRVVHQAAKRPFRKVIGVEISPDLAAVARAAVEARKHQYRCEDVEIVVADARDYSVPDDLTIAYFFHPFNGETLDVVLDDIIGSIDRNPRRVSLVYSYPLGRARVLATGRFRLVKELRGGLRADSLYRTSIYESC